MTGSRPTRRAQLPADTSRRTAARRDTSAVDERDTSPVDERHGSRDVGDRRDVSGPSSHSSVRPGGPVDPGRFRVVGSRPVWGTRPGDVVDRALTVGEAASLTAAGHVARIDELELAHPVRPARPAGSTKPRRRRARKPGGDHA